MMKKLFFVLAALSCALWSCNKNEVDDPSEPGKPENGGSALTLSVSDLVFDAKGGWQEFTIQCPVAWTITGGNAWCQPGATSGSGRSQVKVMVEASMLTEDRNVNLTVKAGTLKAVLAVTQKGVDALTLSKDKFEVEQKGGDITVEVKSNIGYTVTIPTAFSGWLKQSPQSKAMATKNYRFTVLPNEESEMREGYIVFAGNALKDTVRVFQARKEKEKSLILSRDTCLLTSKAQELTVELKTNIDYEIVVPDSVSGWISHLATRAIRTDKLHFSIAGNEGETARTGVVIVKERDGKLSDTLYVIQNKQKYLYFTVNEIRVGSNWQEIPDFMVSNVQHSVVKSPSWLSILTKAINGRRYHLWIGENKSTDAREGMLVLKEKDGDLSDTLYVYQAGWVGLEQREYRVEKEGGTISIEIAVAYDAIIPDLYGQWITLVESEVTDVRRLVFSIPANETDTMRNGIILLKNERDGFTDTLKICQVQNIQIADLNFKEYLLKNFDTNKDGEIDFLEAEGVTKIDLRFTKYFSLEGIQYFKNLTELILNSGEVLLSLDLSKNVELKYLDCQNNSLSSLDLSHNTKLYRLDCRRNHLSTLDLSNNTDLSDLYCSSNQLTSLDLSNNQELRTLSCSYNKLTFLDLLNNRNLRSLDCKYNQLQTLDLSNSQELRELYCGKNQLQSLDFSNTPNITKVDCYENQLTSIHLPNNQKLDWLWCYNNQLQSLDLSNAPNVTGVNCHNNQLVTLYLPNNSNLKSLECYKNLLESLDLPNNPKLETLKCDSCRLKTLTLNCAILWELDCSDNQLQTLDLSKTPKLYQMHCARNQLTSLHFLDSQNLYNLDCYGNRLQALDLPNVSGSLNCSNNQLQSLDLSNVDAAWVRCASNQLTSIHFLNNQRLKYLNCSDNQLQTLDLSNAPNVSTVHCNENQLVSIDLSNNTNLSTLYCKENKMTTIDISCCSPECSLYCKDMPTLKTVYKKRYKQSVSADSGVEILYKE